jgi:hypothetical protein
MKIIAVAFFELEVFVLKKFFDGFILKILIIEDVFPFKK